MIKVNVLSSAALVSLPVHHQNHLTGCWQRERERGGEKEGGRYQRERERERGCSKMYTYMCMYNILYVAVSSSNLLSFNLPLLHVQCHVGTQ